MHTLAGAEDRLRRDIKNEKIDFFILFYPRLALTLAGAEVRLRLGNAQINLAFRSTCTTFAV